MRIKQKINQNSLFSFSNDIGHLKLTTLSIYFSTTNIYFFQKKKLLTYFHLSFS